MRKLVLFSTLLTLSCLYGVGCTPEPTPTPIPETITVRISNPDNQTVMVKGEETPFRIEIEPQDLKGLVAGVNVFGDHGIQCNQSDADMWTWYCQGTQEVEAATVFADVTGDFADQRASYSVKVVTPTPTPASPIDTPTPTPIEPAVAGTPTSAEPTKKPTPGVTEEITSPPPTRGPCSFDAVPFRTPIEGPSVTVEAKITSMENCTDNLPTASPIPLSGAYSGDFANKELWVLVYPPDVKYYPQSSDACSGLSAQFVDGQWRETIRLGRLGVPEAFHIVLVVTEVDSPASEAFKEYLANGCAGKWGFVPVIPPGATELDSIIVHTR